MLIPSRLEQTTLDDVNDIQQAYASEMPGMQEELYAEFQQWNARWNLEIDKPQDLAETLALTNKQLYPNIHAALVTLSRLDWYLEELKYNGAK